ncbi:MAG: penicillin-binding protein 2, partial [Alphaproteobacteria bacterium]|nr:penicillin-binding protein 2 [Alphaproteobacteria bacterium]
EMRRTVEEFHAIGAAGVVLDIKTGELLAMSSLPDFDPHFPSRAGDAQRFDRVALGTYEMGSTFKSFTFALALESGIANLHNGYDASNPLHYANFTITDSHPKRRWLSLPEIYAYSSNVGTARMFLDIGTHRQKEFLNKLGMLKPIDFEMPEHAQPLYPKDWKEINGITIAYGHGISVTPLHLVRGIATLVGDGTLEPLTVLKDGNKDKARGERVISAQTALQMRRLMRMVVRHGTAGKADIAGYRVGGKTGTAEKVQGGGYNKDNKMASFIGVFPIDAPRYIVLVMIDEPKGNKITFGFATGGWIAAPAVGRVIERMAPLMDVKPGFDVAGDDAEQYWVDTEKRPSSPPLPGLRTAAYVRPVAFVTR